MVERVFLLELSGPTIDFLRERADRLPTFQRFLSAGAWSRMRGPLQPMAPCAFATLYTGKNPGRTGLFDFFKFPAGGYERIAYSTALLKHEPFYALLSRLGHRVGLMAVPLTHPLPRVNGFVVSDDEGIGDDFATPPELRERLQRDGYASAFGASYSPGRELAFFRHAMDVIASRRRAMRHAFGNGDWRFGMFGVHSIGELLHAFWKWYDPRHPQHVPLGATWGDTDPLLEAMQAIDEMLAETVDLTGPNGLVLVAGAWGHRLEHAKVHLNAALEQHGWLVYRSSARTRLKHAVFRLGVSPGHAERLAHRLNLYKLFHYKVERGARSAVKGAAFLSYGDVDWSRTRAVAMGYHGQVYLNVRGHRPLGTIAPADYDAERERLRELIAGLADPRTGTPLVDRVFTRDELYHGEELTNAPDLVVHLREGYAGDSGISGGGRLVTDSPPNHSSDHWNQSALLVHGTNVRAGEIAACLEDLAPTVLHALGVKAPGDYDGQVLPIFES
ncbi:MAG: alkaline phosphatase family protein [Gemmatimonadota bacterium]